MSPQPGKKDQPDVPAAIEMQSGSVLYDTTPTPPPPYPTYYTHPHPHPHPHHSQSDFDQNSADSLSKGSIVPDPMTNAPLSSQPLNSVEKWRDLPFAIVFWVHFIALMAVGWWCFSRHYLSLSGAGDVVDGNTKNSPWIIVAISLVISVVASFFLLILTRAHPYFMIQSSLALGIALNILALGLAIYAGTAAGVIFSIIFLVINAFFVVMVQPRIPFSAALLKIAIKCTQIFPSSYLIVLFGFGLNIAWVFLYFFTAGSIVYELENYSNINNSLKYFIYFILALSFYWTAEVIKNVVWVAVSGICGTWYFLYPNNVPAHPGLSSLYRACTYSFGSICFGSLIVAIIKTVRLVLRYIQSTLNQNQNIIVVVIIACAQCLLAITERIINYINSYAYVHVALYGETYIQSAKSTFNLFRIRGFDAIINDSLIEGVTFMLELIVAILTAIIASAIASGFKLNWEAWIGIGFVIGLFVTRIVTSVIEAAVITLFVGLAENPIVLATTKPEEYNMIYPQFRDRGVDLAVNNPIPVQAIPV